MKAPWQVIFGLILVAFLVKGTFAQKKDLTNIAVIDLESRGGLSKAESGTLTDRLRSMLVRTNAFNVVDRGLMNEILSEQGFQMSGCTSTECAVEAGKILGVEQMVSGNIGRIGHLYTVDIVLIDVETAKIIKSLTRDYSGEVEGLVGLMKSIADELAGVQTTTTTPPVVKSGFNIKTKPEGVDVYIDNTYKGKTPASFDNLTPGEHHLKLQKKGYKTIEGKITVQKGKIKPFNTSMNKLYVVNITSTPSEAMVYINGKTEGRTPFHKETTENSRLQITIKKENYKPFEKTLVVRDNINLNARMEYTDAYKQSLVRRAKKNQQKPNIAVKEKSSKTWLWIGGGTVIAAAAVYFILPKKEGSTTTAKFPPPPARP